VNTDESPWNRILKCQPVVTPPAEFAADRAQREHAEQAVERAQLGLFEFD
jgi:hypothetical protein